MVITHLKLTHEVTTASPNLPAAAPPALLEPGANERLFDFARDTFSYENQTRWNYHFDEATGKTTFSRRKEKITYSHHCFVMTRAARQFFFHARFDADAKACDDDTCVQLIRTVLGRPAHLPSAATDRIIIPGYPDLRSFSEQRASLLQATCGGAWRSYVVRSHWRMIFPISRQHQKNTAESLIAAVRRRIPPIIHIVKFPALTINHSMWLFGVAETADGYCFQVYDPNIPSRPLPLTFHRANCTFTLPQLHYWAGGQLDVIEIYRNWWM